MLAVRRAGRSFAPGAKLWREFALLVWGRWASSGLGTGEDIVLNTEENISETSSYSPASRPRASRASVLDRLGRAKRSFTCRRVMFDQVQDLTQLVTPQSGDLLLASVTELGHHGRLETPEGRRAQLYVGDEILVAYGARYAPDQFEAVVPVDLGACDLVAAGGIAARTVARHANVRKATAITPIGILADARGKAINLRRFAMTEPARRAPARDVIAVVGTSMNSGKTTAAANIIRGLSGSGMRVGACKVTGTGSGGDLWSMIDAGAVRALDFTDAGFATTAGADIADLEEAANALVSELESSEVDIIVVEVADGLLQRETAALMNPPSRFVARIEAILLAAADSMGALAGAEWLRARNLPLRAVTGLLTSSPLASREAQAALGLEVIQTKALAESNFAARLCLQAGGSQLRSAV